MRYFRVFFGVGLTGLVAFAAYLTLLSYGLLGGGTVVKVKEVPAGDQEIAFLLPATAGDTWERFIAAVDALEREWPSLNRQPRRLHVNKDAAFDRLTADVPEVSLGLGGANGPRLWVRWYKLSSEADAARWVEELANRRRPPLAVLGGDSSRTALHLAEALERQRGHWRGPDPLFLITTATADGFAPDDQTNFAGDDDETTPGYRRLIEVYRGRSFRYAFTNSRMAEVVLDFVEDTPALWPPLPRRSREVASLAGAVAATGSPGGPGCLQMVVDRLRQPILHTVSWDDDRYSVDLTRRFARAFLRRLRRTPVGEQFQDMFPYRVTFSTGDNFLPNVPERATIREFNEENDRHKDQLQIVALPTAAQRAQRWLRAVVPHLTRSGRRNLVVVSGDSISFNNIYRDRRITWNPNDLNVSLVLFAHRNPVDAEAGFREQKTDESDPSSTGTDDLLLHRDVLESVLLAAHQDGRLLGADTTLERLKQVSWTGTRVGPPGAAALFGADGERRHGTGEYVLWLRPANEKWGPGISVWQWDDGDWVQPEEELWLK